VVAAVESNGEFYELVLYHGAPNLMKMAVHGMPQGAGHKVM